jgi:hypothetical protein
MKQDIPGTTMFDGEQAQKGFALNRMCFSFNSAENRAAFLRDEEAYCQKFGLTQEQRAAVKSRAYWQPFFKGFDYVHHWLAREKPDVAVIFSNDHGLNFFLDKLPTFAIGAANEYRNEDEGWGIPVSRSVLAIRGFPGISLTLSWLTSLTSPYARRC